MTQACCVSPPCQHLQKACLSLYVKHGSEQAASKQARTVCGEATGCTRAHFTAYPVYLLRRQLAVEQQQLLQ